MIPVWAELEKRYPKFDRESFFNDEGRMYRSIDLTSDELLSIISDLRVKHGDYLSKFI